MRHYGTFPVNAFMKKKNHGSNFGILNKRKTSHVKSSVHCSPVGISLAHADIFSKICVRKRGQKCFLQPFLHFSLSAVEVLPNTMVPLVFMKNTK
jgi:hypothetical protein